jgi:hypothetical protein
LQVLDANEHMSYCCVAAGLRHSFQLWQNAAVGAVAVHDALLLLVLLLGAAVPLLAVCLTTAEAVELLLLCACRAVWRRH